MKRVLVALLCAFACAEAAQATTVLTAPSGRKLYTGLLKQPLAYRGLGGANVTLAGCEGLPENFDLRDTAGLVSPIRDQGACGSCWAFSKTASLESSLRAAGGSLLDLSEQELVSCDKSNYGCDGGLINSTEYQVKTGQALEASFKYTASDAACKAGLSHVAKATSWVKLRTVNEEQIKCALWKTRTIPWITVSAGGSRWESPPTGDNAVWPSSANNQQTNHAVGLVGWKRVSGKTYFIMRNSWGTNWGSSGGRPGTQRGYALIPLGADKLGDEVAYATTAATPCQPPRPVLPAEMAGSAGDELILAVKPDPSASYEWFKNDVKIAGQNATSLLFTVEGGDTYYKVVASNSCGKGESKTRVRALAGEWGVDD